MTQKRTERSSRGNKRFIAARNIPSVSRRRLLQMVAGASALTLSSGLLAACGDDDDDDDDDTSSGGTTDEPTATEEAAGGEDEATATEGEMAGGEDEATATEGDGSGEAEATATEGEMTGEDSAAYESCAVGGTLTYALSLDPPNMDPHIDTGSAAANVKMQIYTGLTRFWIGGEIQAGSGRELRDLRRWPDLYLPAREGVTLS
ncbi:MAG: hypothetical protein R2849_05560 [Thermomicrobiales bacterium]